MIKKVLRSHTLYIIIEKSKIKIRKTKYHKKHKIQNRKIKKYKNRNRNLEAAFPTTQIQNFSVFIETSFLFPQSFMELDNQENLPPNMDVIPNARKRGRPSADYKTLYLSLQKRLKRAGLDSASPTPFKDQMAGLHDNSIKNLKDQLKGAEKKLNNIKTQKTGSSHPHWKPYGQKSFRERKRLQAKIRSSIVGRSNQPRQELDLFFTEFLKAQNNAAVASTMKAVMADKQIGGVINNCIVKRAAKRASNDPATICRDYVLRKKMMLSQKKMKLLGKEQSKKEVVISDHIKGTLAKARYSSQNDRKCQAFLRNTFKNKLPFALLDVSIQVEHALVDTKALLESMVAFSS